MMSHRTRVLATALVAILASVAVAPAQPPDAGRLAAAKELMQISGVAKQFDEVMPVLDRYAALQERSR